MALGPSDDVERNASTAGRSKSIVSLTALDGLDEYAALQRYILLYRDKNPSDAAAQANAKDAKKGKSWWQFWRSGSSPNAVPGADPGAVPEDVRTYTHQDTSSCMRMDARQETLAVADAFLCSCLIPTSTTVSPDPKLRHAEGDMGGMNSQPRRPIG